MPLQYPLHQKLLQEALACADDDVRQYFLNHPDISVQNYAFALVEDRYERCRNEKDISDDAQLTKHLSQVMPQVVLEFKLRMVKGWLKEVSAQIKQAQTTNNWGQMRELLKRQVELTDMQRMIADSLKESKIHRF